MHGTFGETLRAVRGELGLTQEAVAHIVGTTQRHLSFLETGRSEPTRAMLGRLVASLELTAAHRAALFAASGYRNPYPTRTLEGAELQATLDLMAQQVLRHWPFRPSWSTETGISCEPTDRGSRCSLRSVE